MVVNNHEVGKTRVTTTRPIWFNFANPSLTRDNSERILMIHKNGRSFPSSSAGKPMSMMTHHALNHFFAATVVVVHSQLISTTGSRVLKGYPSRIQKAATLFPAKTSAWWIVLPLSCAWWQNGFQGRSPLNRIELSGLLCPFLAHGKMKVTWRLQNGKNKIAQKTALNFHVYELILWFIFSHILIVNTWSFSHAHERGSKSHFVVFEQ